MQNLVFPIKTANRFGITNCIEILQKYLFFKSHAAASPVSPAQSPVWMLLSRCQSFLSQSLSFITELSNSNLMLVTLAIILISMFIITCYLIIRLEELQKKVDSPLPRKSETTIEQLAGWQNVLYSHSSKKIQEYLELNLQQIAKVGFIMNLILV